MTTKTYSSVLDHTSDAGFRAWGAELGVNLALAGLVQTADTGQINWTTVTRPGVSTAGGYEIWRFADSTLFLKIEYGTGTSAANPQMWITVGQGSNGTGTLTGQLSTRNIWTANTAPTSTATNYTTYICVIADAMSITWKANSTSTSTVASGVLVIGKSVDGTGAATNLGYGVWISGVSGNNPFFQSVRIVATAQTFTSNLTYFCIPGLVTASLSAGNVQAYLMQLNIPQVLPWPWANVVLVSELTKLNTFSVAMVGSLSHTYLAQGGGQGGALNSLYSQATYSIGVIYE